MKPVVGSVNAIGKGAINNIIINCTSNGPITSQYSGGILGSKAGSESESSCHIIGCSSSGELGSHCGGIVGYHAAINGGNVLCDSCWSTGDQGSTYAGGIFGDSCGYGSGSSIYASNCYSTGYISTGGGGISGASTGRNLGSATFINCYSTGYIDTQAGGIIGFISQNTTVSNCYSIGTVGASTGGGICGQIDEGELTISVNHCYTTGTVVDSKGYIFGDSNFVPTTCFAEADGAWTTSNANSVLEGLPDPIIGTTWVARGTNEPYELREMGYTPYTVNNITEIPTLRREYIETVYPGNYTQHAIISGKSYEILDISGGVPASYDTISINSLLGNIDTIPSTADGTYYVYVRNNGSYHITTFVMTVEYVPPPIPFSYQKAMPQKDITSDGTSSFSTARHSYIRMLQSNTATSLNTVNPTKKWVGGNRDSSQVIANRRIASVGNGSLNAAQVQTSFTTVRDVNTVSDARNRVRAGGATVPAKSRNRIV
jgi:hypothetical protein